MAQLLRYHCKSTLQSSRPAGKKRRLLTILLTTAVLVSVGAPAPRASADIAVSGDLIWAPDPNNPGQFILSLSPDAQNGFYFGFNDVSVTGGSTLLQPVGRISLSYIPPPPPNSNIIPTNPGIGSGLVSGPGSLWDPGTLAVGGVLTVSNGGTLNAADNPGGISAGGNLPNDAGTININSNGMINASSFSIGGSDTASRSSGIIQINSGGTLNFDQGSIFPNGTLIVGPGGILNGNGITLYSDASGAASLQLSPTSILNASIGLAGDTVANLTPGSGSSFGRILRYLPAHPHWRQHLPVAVWASTVACHQICPATAARSTINDVTITAGDASDWIVGGPGSTGSLVLTDTTAAADSLEIGTSVDVIGSDTFLYGEGSVTVGSGAILNITGLIRVGGTQHSLDRTTGDGTLVIQDGGQVTSAGAALEGFGLHPFAHTVEVTDIGSQWTLTDTLQSDAVISIHNGGKIVGVDPVNGNPVNAVILAGTLAIDGPGSAWTTTGTMTIGSGPNPFDATVTITRGGNLTDDVGVLGDSISGHPEAAAVVTIDGTDINGNPSSWVNVTELDVGFGSQGTLHITNGGLVTSFDSTIGTNATTLSVIGTSDTGVGVVTVDGADTLGNPSTWTNTNELHIGYDSQGSLEITNGGLVTSAVGSIGTNASSSGTVSVNGINGESGNASMWKTAGELHIGYDGQGSLAITEGAFVSAGTAYIGTNASSSGLVQVDNIDANGNPSEFQIAGDLNVGNAGSGSLTVTSGGHVDSHFSFIGVQETGLGVATIDGTDSSGNPSTWQSSADINVGVTGTGTLSITGGALVVADTGLIASASGNGSVTVSGIDSAGHPSTFSLAGDLHVGYSGEGTLELTAGAHLDAANSYLGTTSNGQGAASVDGVDKNGKPSTWTSDGDFHVGFDGAGELDITAGGQVISNNGYIGENVHGLGVVNVDGLEVAGNPSTWRIAQVLHVGDAGNGELNITAGGGASAAYAEIGSQAGGTGLVTIDGTDGHGHASTWAIDGDLHIGLLGQGSLTITNGGQVTSMNGFLGDQAGGTASITVDGADGNPSAWHLSGNMVAGSLGTGSLTISNGASVTADRAFLGADENGQGAFIVTDPGSLLTVANDLNVGYNLGTGTLQIENGATVHSGRGFIGGVLATASGTVTVTAPNSVWNSDQQIDVGWLGNGELDILNGGVVNSHAADSSTDTGAVLGVQGNAVGIAKVDGAGSQWNVDGAMVVGLGFIDQSLTSGGTGSLTISNSGLVTSRGAFIGHNPGSSGLVNVISGGLWTITGDLFIGDQGEAQLTINGGSVTANNVTLGNNPATPDLENDLIVSGTMGSLITTHLITSHNLTTIAVSLGGTLTAADTDLSANPGSSTVVSVNDTSVLNLGTLTIGDQGFARINLLGVATKLTASAVILGNQAAGSGLLQAALLANSVNFTSTIVGNFGAGSILVEDKNTLNLGDTTVANAAGATGQITFQAGGTFTTASLTVGEFGAGTITLQNKVNFSTGDVTIADQPLSTGTLTVDTQTKWLSFGQLTVGHQGNATLNIDGGATVAVAHAAIGDDPQGTGLINLQGSGSKLTVTTSLIVGITGATAKSAVLTIGMGSSVVSPFTTLEPSGLIDGKGILTGKLTNAGGIVAPGNSPGTLEIDGDFEQTAGELEIQAAGLQSGDYDQLITTGSINIHGGTVLFSFLNGYIPQAGQTFSFLESAAGASIDFSTTALAFDGVAPGFQFAVEPDLAGGYQFRALTDALPIPEPATLPLALAPLLLLCRRKKNRPASSFRFSAATSAAGQTGNKISVNFATNPRRAGPASRPFAHDRQRLPDSDEHQLIPRCWSRTLAARRLST